MTKLKRFITKHDSLCVFLLFLLISVGFVFRNVILGFDSLWVFGNLYKLSNGLQIYEEVNILTFPLFYELFRMLLTLFNNYLGFLLLNFLIITPLYFMIYQVFKVCNVKKSFALLFTMVIWIITNQMTAFGPSYSTFSLLLYIAGLFFYFKKKDSKFSFVIQGILAFLILLSHQKFGAAYIGALLLLHLFNIKSEKKSIVTLLKTYSVTFVLCLLFVLILFLTNRLNSFLDLTILNMGSFTQNVSFAISTVLYLLGTLAFLVFGFILIKKKYNNYKPLKALLCFSFSLLLVVYPILNEYHFLLFFAVFFILVFFMLYNLFENFLNNKTINKLVTVISVLLALFLVSNSIVRFVIWNDKHLKTPGNVFYGAVIDEKLINPINETTEYINALKEQGKHYRILSLHAMFYTLYDVPEKNNNYFDLPLRGNLGKEDWHTLSNILDQEPEGTYIIIDRKINDKFLIYQFPEEIFNYVNEHYKYVQDIGCYAVYEK